MEIWLELCTYDDPNEVYMNTLLRVPNSDLWLDDMGGLLEECNYTPKFWEMVESGEVELVKIGEF